MALPKRQTSLLCLTVIATAIFAWQLLELFTHDIAAAPSAPHLLMPPPASLPTPEERDFQQLLQRYELAKLQHRVADEELAIAKAQQSMRALTQAQTATASMEDQPPWQLKYLGRHQDHWSATLAHDDQLINVFTGMKLTQHLVVVGINSQGVWLRAPEHLYQLTFAGIVAANTAAALAPSQPTPPPTLPQAPTLPATLPVAPSTRSPVTTSAHTPSFDETVLLAMPMHSYTIQLATRDNPPELLHLMRKHHIKSRSFVYSHACATGTCYSLVYGDFLTMSAAQTAQMNLPTALAEASPEIVPLHKIQQAILQH